VSVHKLEIFSDRDWGPTMRLVCTATKGSDCRMTPIDGRESWEFGDHDLVDCECLVVGYIEAAGFQDSVRTVEDGVFASIPVVAHYDDGIVLSIPTIGTEPLEGLDIEGESQ
jgi:hypothetical protein